jgi:flavin-dependent dehydrogenase
VNRDREVVVVGGGPAGSAVASLLARAGRDVLLLERDAFPRDKLCGEFLSSESLGILRKLGCLDRIERIGAVAIEHARFTAPSGAALSIELPAAALGISRVALDRILFAHAAECGAETVERAEAKAIERRGARFEIHLSRERERLPEIVTARFVVCAYGRRARIDRAMSRRFTEERHPYVAFKRHHRPTADRVARELAGRVEIHTVDGGYCGMSQVESGEVNVCMLLMQRFVDRLPDTEWPTIQRALSGSNRHLAERFTALAPSDDALHAVAEIPFSLKERAKDGVLFVGDAAGMIAPLAGDGQAMALDSAVMLAEAMSPFPREPSEHELEVLGRRWDLRWRLAFEPRMRLAKGLQDLLFDPVAADRAIRWIGLVPGLGGLLARLTRGSTRARG